MSNWDRVAKKDLVAKMFLDSYKNNITFLEILKEDIGLGDVMKKTSYNDKFKVILNNSSINRGVSSHLYVTYKYYSKLEHNGYMTFFTFTNNKDIIIDEYLIPVYLFKIINEKINLIKGEKYNQLIKGIFNFSNIYNF